VIRTATVHETATSPIGNLLLTRRKDFAMSGDKHRRAASALLATRPGQHEGEHEEVLGASPAWVARVGRRGHVFFVGRHRHLVALTDRRLVTWRHPRRARKHPGAAASIDVPLSALRREGERAAKPFVQVLATVDTGDTGDRRARGGAQTLVIELRHRDRAFARALASALGPPLAAPSAV
jgi:hypothetical protein